MAEAPDLVLNPDKTPLYRLRAALVARSRQAALSPDRGGSENIPLTGPVLIAPSPPLERRLRLHAVHVAAQGLLHGEGRCLYKSSLFGAS